MKTPETATPDELGAASGSPLPLTCDVFGGKHALEYNALRSAMTTAARMAGHTGEYAEYEWLDEVPRTSLTVELVDALHRHGFTIQRANPKLTSA